MAEAHGGTAAAGDVGFPAVEDGDGRGGFFAVTVFFLLSFSLMHKQFQLLEWGGRRMGLEMTNLLNERWALDVETHVSTLISESTRSVLTNLLLLLFL